jgi:hypothetical protein
MQAYQEMCALEDPVALAELRAALLEYCRLDTLAMVRILEKLRALGENGCYGIDSNQKT